MSEKPRERRPRVWMDVIFWTIVALVFATLYASGVLDGVAHRFARPWF